MDRALLDRLGTLVLALLLGLIIWVNATYQTDRPREDFFPTQVPIQVLTEPDSLAVVNEPAETVRVRIRAFASSWDTLTVDDFSATVDWNDLDEGMHVVPIELAVSDPTVTIVSIHPQAMYVRLEQLSTEEHIVEINIQGADQVPLGYQVYSESVSPRQVTLIGPASQIERVNSVVGDVSVANQRSPVERDVPLMALDEAGQELTAVQINPSTVQVRVPIEQRQNFREVAVRVRTEGQPARGYYVSSINVLPATVTVVGPPVTIAELGSLIEVRGTLDVSDATRLIAERMELDLPEGVNVLGSQDGDPFEVLVTVGVDAVTGGTTVELPLRIERLQEGLQATNIVPMVDVILTGPAVVLDELQIDRLRAYLDLGGLGPGTHQVQPRVEIASEGEEALEDLVVRDILPQYVEVTIEQAPTLTPTGPDTGLSGATPAATPTLYPTLTPTPTN